MQDKIYRVHFESEDSYLMAACGLTCPAEANFVRPASELHEMELTQNIHEVTCKKCRRTQWFKAKRAETKEYETAKRIYGGTNILGFDTTFHPRTGDTIEGIGGIVGIYVGLSPADVHWVSWSRSGTIDDRTRLGAERMTPNLKRLQERARA